MSGGGNLEGFFSRTYYCDEDDEHFSNLDKGVNEFYLVRHGKSTANVGQEKMMRGHATGAMDFKGKWDPPLHPMVWWNL